MVDDPAEAGTIIYCTEILDWAARVAITKTQEVRCSSASPGNLEREANRRAVDRGVDCERLRVGSGKEKSSRDKDGLHGGWEEEERVEERE